VRTMTIVNFFSMVPAKKKLLFNGHFSNAVLKMLISCIEEIMHDLF
jgi:hypothetical protein